MEIKELTLTAFGKYKSKQISFTNGINIVYGENESGKSTIHKFIEAMLFGFFKDQKNRRAYNEDYAKYLPMYSENYGGTLIFKENHREIRVERNLLKGRDLVVLYENNTGEDISREFTYDEATKLYNPLNPSIMNRRIFNNTVSVSQLGCGTSKDLAEELKDKLANFGEGRVDLSVQNAIQTLEAQLHALGTEKRKNTPLYEVITSLEDLQKEKDSILNAMEKVSQLRKESSILDDTIHRLLDNKEKITKSIHAANSFKSFTKLQEYNEKINENNRLQQELTKLTYRNVSEDDYYSIVKFADEIVILTKQLESINEKKMICFSHISEHKNKSQDNYSFTYQEVENDYNEILTLTNEKKILDYKKVNNNQFLLEDKLRALVIDVKSRRIIAITSILLSIFGIILGAIYHPIFYALCISLGVSYINYKAIGVKKSEIHILNEKVNQVRDHIKSTEERLEELEGKIRGLYHKYSCNSYEEFVKDIYEKYKSAFSDLENSNKNLLTLEERLRSYDDATADCEMEIERLREKITLLLKKNDVSSQEDFITNLECVKKAKELKLRVRQNSLVAERIIETKDLETISKLAAKYTELKEYKVLEDMDTLMINKKDMEQMIKEKEIEKSNIEGRIDSLINQGSDLSDIETGITYLENELSKIKSKEKSLRLAMDTIHSISEEIHRELAPELNRLLANIIKTITGKYDTVKVSKDLDIKVEEPIYHKLINLNLLSSGTMDQIFFSFRMGLNSFLNKKEFPVLLDEAFVQYDDQRLLNVLEYLVQSSKERQIILFSSQKRELQLLDKYGHQFHLIELD